MPGVWEAAGKQGSDTQTTEASLCELLRCAEKPGDARRSLEQRCERRPATMEVPSTRPQPHPAPPV